MTALATDSFTGAGPSFGAQWITQTGETANYILSSNRLQNAADNVDTAYNNNAVTWPNDQYAQAVMTATSGFSSGNGPGVGLRMSTSANTYYRIIFNHAATNNIKFHKVVATTHTDIVNRTSAWSDGATNYAEIQSTTLQAKINGSNAGASTTDSAISSGRAGITYSSQGGSEVGTLDNWEGGDFASAGLPPGLGPDAAMDETALNMQCQIAMMR